MENDFLNHARVHLKHLLETTYVLYHTIPSPLGGSNAAVEEHLIELTPEDLDQIERDLAQIRLLAPNREQLAKLTPAPTLHTGGPTPAAASDPIF